MNRALLFIIALTGCGDIGSLQILGVPVDDGLLPDAADLPIGGGRLQAWIDAEFEAEGYDVKLGVLEDRGMTHTATKTVRLCTSCEDTAQELLWATSHELVHVWWFGEDGSLLKYLDHETRFALELQATRFQMRVYGLAAGPSPSYWVDTCAGLVPGSSLTRGVTDDAMAMIKNELWREFHESYAIAAPIFAAD